MSCVVRMVPDGTFESSRRAHRFIAEVSGRFRHRFPAPGGSAVRRNPVAIGPSCGTDDGARMEAGKEGRFLRQDSAA